MIGAFDISQSALVAQRARMDVIAGNIANAEVTRQEDGTIQPYRRRYVALAAGDGRGGAGVHVAEIAEDPSAFPLRYDEGHPDRIREGPLTNYVQTPNVNITMEYIDAMQAARAYEANLAVMGVTRTMVQQAVRLFA